jgi:hypothetical protein
MRPAGKQFTVVQGKLVQIISFCRQDQWSEFLKILQVIPDKNLGYSKVTVH